MYLPPASFCLSERSLEPRILPQAAGWGLHSKRTVEIWIIMNETALYNLISWKALCWVCTVNSMFRNALLRNQLVKCKSGEGRVEAKYARHKPVENGNLSSDTTVLSRNVEGQVMKIDPR
jgi:hypothetical protein